MNPYPKRILTIPQQLQSYTDAGMTISSVEEVFLHAGICTTPRVSQYTLPSWAVSPYIISQSPPP